MRDLTMLIRSEAKMTLREPADLIIPLGLPVLLLVMTGLQSRDAPALAGGRSVLEVVGLPVAFTMAAALIGIVTMPTLVTTYRKSGVLRRLAVTPVSPLRLLGARFIVSGLQTAAGIALAYTVGRTAFQAQPPAAPLAALGIIVLTTTAMYSLGMVVASLAPSPNAAVACGFVLFLGFGALGGMFGGADTLPEPLATIGALLPFGAAVQAMAATVIGAPIPPQSLLSLGTCTVVGTSLSAWAFRWNR